MASAYYVSCFARRLPRSAYEYAETQPLYARAVRVLAFVEGCGAVTPTARRVLLELPHVEQVRVAYVCAASVLHFWERAHPQDHHPRATIAVVERWLKERVTAQECLEATTPEDTSADGYRWRATAMLAFRAARCAANTDDDAADWSVSNLEAAAKAVDLGMGLVANDPGQQPRCTPGWLLVRRILSAVVREHLARRWTAYALWDARSRGVRLFGSLEARGVAADLLLERSVPISLKPSVKLANRPWLTGFLRRLGFLGPAAYLGSEHVSDLSLYIAAHATARKDLGVQAYGSGEELLLDDFAKWMEERLSATSPFGWAGLIEMVDSSERNVHSFLRLFDEFLLEHGDPGFWLP